MLLDELGTPYTLHSITVRKGDQNKLEFRAMNPTTRSCSISPERMVRLLQRICAIKSVAGMGALPSRRSWTHVRAIRLLPAGST
jgi:hypothetical protein